MPCVKITTYKASEIDWGCVRKFKFTAGYGSTKAEVA